MMYNKIEIFFNLCIKVGELDFDEVELLILFVGCGVCSVCVLIYLVVVCKISVCIMIVNIDCLL